MTDATHQHHDPADSVRASYWPTYDDRPEDIWADEWLEMCRAAEVRVCPEAVGFGKAAMRNTLAGCDRDAHRLAQREAIVRFLQQAREVSSCPDLQYFVDCWQLAFEMDDDGESQTAVADRHGVSRAAVSKRVVEIRKAATGQNVARGQKSRAAAKVYQLRQFIVGQSRTKKPAQNQIQKNAKSLWTEISLSLA